MLRIEGVNVDKIPAYGEIRNAWNEVLEAREKAEDQERVLAETIDSEEWEEQLEKLQALRMKLRIREESFVDLSLRRKACIVPRYPLRNEDN